MLAIDFGAEGTVVVSGRLDAAQCPVAQSFLDGVDGTVTLDCAGLESSPPSKPRTNFRDRRV